MWRSLFLLFFLGPLDAREVIVLTQRDLVLLSKEAIEPDPLPKNEKPYINNDLVDSFNRPYKRFVFKGSYSEGRDPHDEGGGAAYYYLNSYVFMKTGPSYNKINYRDKYWKWSAQFTFSYPIFPLK